MTAPAFERDRPPPGPSIRRYSAAGFEVGGRSYRALLLTPEEALDWEPPASARDLTLDDLEPLLGASPSYEFLLLGTGPTMAFAPPALVEALAQRDIGLEAMDSRAAARTWAVLRAEGRWIAAAIMPL